MGVRGEGHTAAAVLPGKKPGTHFIGVCMGARAV